MVDSRDVAWLILNGSDNLHDRLLGSFARPKWLLNRSLIEDVWQISAGHEQLKRHDDTRMPFDVPLAPGVLASDLRDTDCLTAKLLAYWSLEKGGRMPGGAVAIMVRDYFQFVRWRLHQGLSHNALMTEPWWKLLFSDLKARGVSGLVPLNDRAHAVVNRLRGGDIKIPLSQKGRLSIHGLALELGISERARLPRSVRDILADYAEEIGVEFNRGLITPVVEEEVEEGVTSASRLAAFLTSLNNLWIYRRELSHDAPAYQPFDGEFTPAAIASTLGRSEDGRTLTISAQQVCYLVDHAIRWIMDHGPAIRRYVSELVKRLDDGTSSGDPAQYSTIAERLNATFDPQVSEDSDYSPWPIRPSYRRSNRAKVVDPRPSLKDVVGVLLPAACLIVIAAFSARRHEELKSLRATSLTRDEEGFWLNSWIGKTTKGIGIIPVPNVVAEAVSTLVWLSESYRSRTGKPWLLAYDDFYVSEMLTGRSSIDLYQVLEKFALFVQVPPAADGTPWVPKPHQFRRFFGILYFHRFRFPNLAALSRHYRHHDPDVTRRYITEEAHGGFLRMREEQRVAEKARNRAVNPASWLKDFEDEALNFRVERFTNVAKGEEEMTGWGGRALTAEVQALVEEIRVRLELGPTDALPDQTLNVVITEFARDKRLEPNPSGHSLCKCTHKATDLRSAACLAELQEEAADNYMSAPNAANASDFVCSGCPHNVQLEECEPYWTDLVAQTAKQAACAFSPLLRAMLERRNSMAREHLSRCFRRKKGGS